MSKLIRRVLAVILAAALCSSMAAFASPAESGTGDETVIYVNPLYADVVDEQEIEADTAAIPATTSVTWYGTEYLDFEECAAQIQEYLIEHQFDFTVNYCYTVSATEYNDVIAELQNECKSLFNAALEHTGSGDAGDYLMWNFKGYACGIGFSNSGSTYYLQYRYVVDYYTSAEQETVLAEKIEDVMDDIIEPSMIDYEKVCAIYYYIYHNVFFFYDKVNYEIYTLKYTAYAAMVNGTAVCQGYATLFYRMALEAGVDCRVIPGSSTDPNTEEAEGHAWNIVKLGDSYYNVDATWDSNYTPGQYVYFLKSMDNFDNHDRGSDYTTAAFNAAYPMASGNYDPETCGGNTPNHSLESVAQTDATCTEAGNSAYWYCPVCGKYFSDANGETEIEISDTILPAAGHTLTHVDAAEPTTNSNGNIEYWCCSACGKYFSDETAEHELSEDETIRFGHVHTGVYVEAQEATCTEAGNSEYWYCEECGEMFADADLTEFIDPVIPATGHSWDEGAVTVEATCIAEGEMTYTCTKCDATYTEPIGVTDHVWDEGIVKTQPGCETTGEREYTCTVCGATETEEVAALGHNYQKEETKAETCTEDGLFTFTCSRCGASYTEFELAPGHQWDDGEITVKPTCTSVGIITYTCTVCQETYSEAIDALGHTWDDGEITIEPGCTSVGLITYTCTACDATYTEAIEALGHDWDEGQITLEPTCSYPGTLKYTCSVCGETEDEILSPVDHTWDEGTITTEPTCAEEGKRTYTCTVCGATKTEAIAPSGEGIVDRVYYIDGERQNTTGCLKINGTWYCLVNGVVTPYSVQHNDNGWWCSDGNGEVNFDYTGFGTNANGTWYAHGNKVNFSQTGVYQDKAGAIGTANTWYYYSGDKVQTSYTGVLNAAYNGGWWYVKNGAVDFTYTGFSSNSNGKWYVEGGKVTFNTNSVLKDSTGAIGTAGTWWYVVGSKVQTTYTGVANYANSNGWCYIKNGAVDWTASTVAKNNTGWW